MVDSITDFSVPDDTTRLDHLEFKGDGVGGLAARAVVSGVVAVQSDDCLVNDAGTGVLCYDCDGTGAALAVQLAQMTGG